MKQIFFYALLISVALPMFTAIQAQQTKSFYDFTVQDIDGNPFKLSSLKGKKVLVVNVASKCGNTPQYADLEKLYLEYKDRNFVVIGFPANNFLSQEPGTNEEIKNFCTLNYNVTFPMMSKISVKGKDMAPVYDWLTSKELNGVADSEVTWNFQKYMIDENGKLVGSVAPKEKPYSDKIVNWIKGS
jgi:glutathione peroxidase